MASDLIPAVMGACFGATIVAMAVQLWSVEPFLSGLLLALLMLSVLSGVVIHELRYR